MGNDIYGWYIFISKTVCFGHYSQNKVRGAKYAIQRRSKIKREEERGNSCLLQSPLSTGPKISAPVNLHLDWALRVFYRVMLVVKLPPIYVFMNYLGCGLAFIYYGKFVC